MAKKHPEAQEKTEQARSRRIFLKRMAGTGLATAAGVSLLPEVGSADPFDYIRAVDEQRAGGAPGAPPGTTPSPMPAGEAPKQLPRIPPPDPTAAEVPAGFLVEIAAADLTYPTSVEFDPTGTLYVAEGGFAYGDDVAPARIFRIAATGERQVIADQLNGPITDLLWHQDRLYISHRGKISAVVPGGSIQDLVTDLPSLGDHHNNQMSVGPDGRIYFGQGTATNSGVVGLDSFKFGWLQKFPDFHDFPAQDIRVTGQAFQTPDPVTALARSTTQVVSTSPFQPFGKTVPAGTVVPGTVKANGTILRMNPDGSGLEVYAWGLRNPFGVMWDPNGQLYVAENAYDERGSRPIANALDNIWVIQQGAWYGFPDYSSGIPLTDPRFRSPRGPAPQFLMQEHPPVPQPWLTRPSHSGVTKIAFSATGQMYLAEVGDMAPATGTVGESVGFQVVRINPTTKMVEPFFRVKEAAEGPPGMEYVVTAGPKRPVDVHFAPQGDILYVVDIGALAVVPTAVGPAPHPFPRTGVVWRIVPA